MTVSVGTREISRSRATYEEVYDYLSQEVGAACMLKFTGSGYYIL